MELLKKRKVYEKLEDAYGEQYNKWFEDNKDAFTPAVGNLQVYLSLRIDEDVELYIFHQ